MANTSGGDSSQALAAFGVQAGPEIGQEFPVRLPTVTIGRGSQNDLVLADDSVSTTHARLEYEAGHWRLTDLNSTNGTYVESVRLAPEVPTPLPYGALVRFGGVRLQFRAVETADPEAARASYAPPAAPTPLAERSRGFRLPLWLFALILLVVGAIVFFLVTQSQLLEPAAPAVESVSLGVVPAASPPGS